MTMKKLLLMVVVLLSFMATAQNRTVTHIEDNLYKGVIESGTITQTGYYLKKGDDFVLHGKWKMYSNGELLQVGVYKDGKMVKHRVRRNGKRQTYLVQDGQYTLLYPRPRLSETEKAINRLELLGYVVQLAKVN